jgi:hypothetical protein
LPGDGEHPALGSMRAGKVIDRKISSSSRYRTAPANHNLLKLELEFLFFVSFNSAMAPFRAAFGNVLAGSSILFPPK